MNVNHHLQVLRPFSPLEKNYMFKSYSVLKREITLWTRLVDNTPTPNEKRLTSLFKIFQMFNKILTHCKIINSMYLSPSRTKFFMGKYNV